MEADERERAIIARAKELLKGRAAMRMIDAAFAYDFDPDWNWHIESIRNRALGQSNPYSRQVDGELRRGFGIEIDSDDLWDAIVYRLPIVIGPKRNNIAEVSGQFEVLKPRRKDSTDPDHRIICENGEYYERIEWDASVRLRNASAEDRQIWESWNEGLDDARGEVYRNAKEYEARVIRFNNLIRAIAKRYSLDAKIVRGAVLWGDTPRIPYEDGEYILSEWQQGKIKFVRVMSWDVGEWRPIEPGRTEDGGDYSVSSAMKFERPPMPKRRQYMSNLVRVRTWTIYRLHTRGGGQLTLEAAIELWNSRFKSEYLDSDKRTNYGHQLDSLLGKKQVKDYEEWRKTIEATPI